MLTLTSLLIPLYLALLVDLLLGDPPNRFHPVAWMGTFIAAMRRWSERGTHRKGKSLAWGIALVVTGLTITITIGWLIEYGLARLPQVFRWVGQALILKATFSVRGLVSAANRVAKSLADGNLTDARTWLHQHLVSRDTSNLDDSAIAAATVESVAENASDSAVAPLFYYAIAGLPGALAYRFVNTADAMVGYHDERHEWFGKPVARLDDLLNLLPARLTATLMLLSAPLVGGSATCGIKVWWRDARLTASPNAGQPMSMAAGILGVELEKVGHYHLGVGQPKASPKDIGRVARLFYVTIGWLFILITLLAVVWQS